MNDFADRAPENALAEGFADRVERWAREAGAPEAAALMLRRAAQATSLATSAGQVCIRLADLAAATGNASEAQWREALSASGLVGTPEAPGALPLVQDGDGRLYLHRYFDYECRLARQLRLPLAAQRKRAAGATRALLDGMFPPRATGDARPDWQRIAAALALENRLTIVSGGPGTGKTTTVVNLLGCVLGADPQCRVRLAAPTGKAAARMLEAIRERAAQLPRDIAERLPDESFTVHRLLGVTGDAGRFRHGAENPLPLDLLVVDEASMLDLALATRLLEAVPPAGRIVLLGDKDQLAAVEAGAVFAELCADPTLSEARTRRLAALTGIAAESIRPSAPARRTGLADCVVWLTENFRFPETSRIGRLARMVNAGDATAALTELRAARDATLDWIEDGEPALRPASLARIEASLAGYLDAARQGLAEPAALFAAFGRMRVLCAERNGPRGVEAINALATRRFREALAHPLDRGARSEWYPGRPVMVLRNDYVQKLYNGDVGIVLPEDSGSLGVFVPASDGGFRTIAPARLPEHETAFATTVHKAQGSEFDRVLLVLPAGASRVATRELVYTAVTRAREGVTIVGSEAVIDTAIRSPTIRHSGLAARLAAQPGPQLSPHAKMTR